MGALQWWTLELHGQVSSYLDTGACAINHPHLSMITGLLGNFVQYKKYRNGIYGQSKLCLLPLRLLLVPLTEILLPEYIFKHRGSLYM